MAQSPEYPDLKWMPPRSWTDANRTAVQLVVIHTTEGSAHAQSAEDGAAYDQRRTDGTSTHYFHDSNSTVQCVRTADQAHTARTQGNRRGIHHELCGRTTIDWSGTYAQAMLRQAAKQCARDAKKWDIPVRKLTAAQVADGVKGFCGHVEITKAFPADRGTHTDPGPNFPWPQFLDLVRAEMEDEVTEAELIAAVTRSLASVDGQAAIAKAAGVGVHGQRLGRSTTTIGQAIQTTLGLVSRDLVDEPAIVAGVLAGLPVSAIAAAIPEALTEALTEDLIARLPKATVDALVARLQARE